jgi:hypothetical protein
MIAAQEIDGELWIKASDHHRAIKDTKREWVGLTAQEAADIAESVYGSAHHDDITFFIEIQIKLKEKNT